MNREFYGHYLYLEQPFRTKLEALERAWARGDHDPKISFYFHDDAFASSTVEPEASLAELYRARAQELRERFDHLILMYSGGADSDQVLMTFLRNGIHLDEVRTHCPLGFAERLDDDPPQGLKILSQYREQAAPGLGLVKKCSSRTNTWLDDWTAAIANAPWSETWLEALCPWPKPNGSLYNAIRRNWEASHLQRVADQLHGKTVGVIYGTEKPYMRLIGNDVYFFFADVARVGMYNFFVAGGEPLFTPVMFYWGSPEIVIKQAHVIKRALEQPAALAHVRLTRCNVYPDTGIPGIDLSLIYPDWRRQKQAKVAGTNTEIITHFIERPVKEFTALRRGHFETLFRAGGAGDYLSETQTKLHHVGTIDISALQNLDKDWPRSLGAPSFAYTRRD